MADAGFDAYDTEWWHFTLRGEPFAKRAFNFPVTARAIECTARLLADRGAKAKRVSRVTRYARDSEVIGDRLVTSSPGS